jgi:hypothetical protein
MRRAPLLLIALLATGSASAQWVAPGGFIPVVAYNPGLNDTFWRSDVSVLNPNGQATTVILQLYPEIRGGTPAFAVQTSDPISVPANGQVTLSNVVQATFGLFNVKGALHVWSLDGSGLVIASRTYTNDTQGGTYGQDVTGMLVAGTAWAGGLRHDGFFRTNLGIFWPWDQAAHFTVTVHDATGATAGSGVVSFTEAGLQQLSFDAFGVDTLVDGYAVITCDDPGAVWYGYASRVDQITGDAVFRVARGYQSALP